MCDETAVPSCVWLASAFRSPLIQRCSRLTPSEVGWHSAVVCCVTIVLDACVLRQAPTCRTTKTCWRSGLDLPSARCSCSYPTLPLWQRFAWRASATAPPPSQLQPPTSCISCVRCARGGCPCQRWHSGSSTRALWWWVPPVVGPTAMVMAVAMASVIVSRTRWLTTLATTMMNARWRPELVWSALLPRTTPPNASCRCCLGAPCSSCRLCCQ